MEDSSRGLVFICMADGRQCFVSVCVFNERESLGRPSFWLQSWQIWLRSARCLYPVYTSLPSAMIFQSESADHPRVRPFLNIHFHMQLQTVFFPSKKRSCCAVAQRAVFEWQYIYFVESSQLAVLSPGGEKVKWAHSLLFQTGGR